MTKSNSEPRTPTPTAQEPKLCSECGGNGVIKIHHGTSVCPRCDGRCYEPSAPTLQPEALRALIARWRAIADAIIDDVNQGNAPVCDADWAMAHRDCAHDLEKLLHAGTAQEPTP